jgi:hypothetical protein
VRNSIRLVVGYAGLSIAALLAVSAAGINLSSLALVAGALSVGIGFGLQNIVNNFVSGLILLVERPFKVGDWIVAGSAEGIVKKISVRATEIETFRRQTVMLPNSELINSAVGNWTHRNRVRRLDIPVVAAAGADPRKVHALLQEIARAQPQGLKNPEPVVSFDSVGDLGMKFQVMIYLADLSDGGTVQNEVLFSIVDTFEREGVEIAFLPRQVQPKARKVAAWPSDDDRSEAEHVERAARAQAAKPKPGRRRRRPDPALASLVRTAQAGFRRKAVPSRDERDDAVAYAGRHQRQQAHPPGEAARKTGLEAAFGDDPGDARGGRARRHQSRPRHFEPFGERRLHEAGIHHLDADVELDEVVAQRFRDAVQRGLGRAVGRGQR